MQKMFYNIRPFWIEMELREVESILVLDSEQLKTQTSLEGRSRNGFGFPPSLPLPLSLLHFPVHPFSSLSLSLSLFLSLSLSLTNLLQSQFIAASSIMR